MRLMRAVNRFRFFCAMSIVFAGVFFAKPSFADLDGYEVGVDGMSCPFCTYGIEKKLKALDGVSSMEINLQQATIDVTVEDDKSVTPDELKKAVKKAGFEMRELHVRGKATVEKQGDSTFARFTKDFRLPIRGDAPEPGTRSLSGKVVEKDGTWTLKLEN